MTTTAPEPMVTDPFGDLDPATRRAVVRVATARVVDGHLVCDPTEAVELDLRRATRTR